MRFIVRKFLEAKNIEEVLKKERRTPPSEIYLDNEVWKERGYVLKDEKNNKIGFGNNAKENNK